MTVICCLYCGMTAVDLRDDHPCRPNLSAADLAQVARGAAMPRMTLGDILKERRGQRSRRSPQPHLHAGTPSTRLSGLVRTVNEATEGQRNATLHWAACRAGEMVAEGTLTSPWEAVELLTVAADAAGLDAREIAGTIASGFRTSGVSL